MDRLQLMMLVAASAMASTFAGCGQKEHTIEVTNPLAKEREGEIVSLDAKEVTDIYGENFRIVAPDSTEVPWQITYDGQLLFPATVGAGGSTVYTLCGGASAAAADYTGVGVPDTIAVDFGLLDANGTPVYMTDVDSVKVLDNGPLRRTVELVYSPAVVWADTAVVQHRVISVDRGQMLQRNDISYRGLSESGKTVAGIRMLQSNISDFTVDHGKHTISYTNMSADSVPLYITVVAPSNSYPEYRPYPRQKADTVAQLMVWLPMDNKKSVSFYVGETLQNTDGIANVYDWDDTMEKETKLISSPLKAVLK